MTSFDHPYVPRRIRFLDLWETSGWRLKVYGISQGDAAPATELVEAARSVVRGRLPVPATADGRYGVGFVGVHQGRGSNVAFVDWWADVNELHHHVFVSYPAAPRALTDVTATGLLGCVWDLALMAFERDAWIDAVLAPRGGPDLEGYLARRLDERV